MGTKTLRGTNLHNNPQWKEGNVIPTQSYFEVKRSLGYEKSLVFYGHRVSGSVAIHSNHCKDWRWVVGIHVTSIIFQHPVSPIYQPKKKCCNCRWSGGVTLQLSNHALILFSLMVGGISTDACETFAKNARFQLRVDLTPWGTPPKKQDNRLGFPRPCELPSFSMFVCSEWEPKMGVSKNNGTPKSSILIGFSIIDHPFWGTPIFRSIQINPNKIKHPDPPRSIDWVPIFRGHGWGGVDGGGDGRNTCGGCLDRNSSLAVSNRRKMD